MNKEKRKQQSGRHIPKVVYVIVALALLMGIILGIGMNREPEKVVDKAVATVTQSTGATSDSNTVDLPELQTQWAELDITKTAVTDSRSTPTPQ